MADLLIIPETDRKAATTALAAAAGGKLTRYAGLRGKYDFMAEIEGTFEQAAAAAMVAVVKWSCFRFYNFRRCKS